MKVRQFVPSKSFSDRADIVKCRDGFAMLEYQGLGKNRFPIFGEGIEKVKMIQ